MAKNNSTYLLIPGETWWEFWNIAPGVPATMESSHPVMKPSEIEKVPQGDIIFLFPVKALTALPMHVATSDTSLFPDLAATHAERSGIRTDPFAGQLSDVFPVSSGSEGSVFLSVFLRSPQPDELPLKSPKAFDISPRAFPTIGNTLTVWRELGNWVFAIHSEGKLLYCQATSVSTPSPDASLVREIRIAIAQLSMQGVRAEPSNATVWSSDPDTDTSHISRSLSLQTRLEPRPAPVTPEPLSKLLPADVRAARRAARKRQNTILVIAALAVIYLGTIGYLGYGLWKTRSTTNELLTQTNLIAPQKEAYQLHIAKWDELEYGIDLNHNTVDILNRVARSIPPGSGLRLRTADISPNEIRLIGEAPQPAAVGAFSKNLMRNNDLAAFEWQTPEPKQTNRGWEFVFTASTPMAAP